MRRSYMGHVLKTGAIIGLLVGLLGSFLVIGWLWFADAKAGTEYATRMAGPVLLVCMGGSTIAVMLAYAVRWARVDLASVLQQNLVIKADEWEQVAREETPFHEWGLDEVYGDETGTQEMAPWAIAKGPAPPLPAAPDTTLGDRIVQCMYMQAEWHYAFQRNPTRAAFEGQGTPQPIWNSARDLLRMTGVVTDTGWADLTWAQVQSRLARTHVDPDRIWVVNGRTLVPVMYDSQLINNRYTRAAPPQDAV